MRVCKRQMKGKIVFALLLAMLVTLVWPVSSYADELGDGTAADTVEKDVENGSDESGNAGDDSVPETKDEPESEDKDEAEAEIDGNDSEHVIKNPTDPSNPSNPSGSISGSTSGDIKYPDKAVSVVIEEINSSTPGQTVQLNMNSWTSVPMEILQAAKGKDVNVVLLMDGYSWTINGKDIQTIYNRDRTDLKVTKNTNNIPGSTVTAVAGDNPSLQISLAHEGDFGFKATLSIGVGSEHAGKYGNLYYHDKNGKLVFIDACQINSEGNVSLVFSHASDYLLVISDQAMSQVNVPENLKPAGTNQNGAASTENTNSGSTSGDIKYPDKAVSVVIEEINSSTPGQTVQLNMNSWTSVPMEILQAAKGKDVNVVLLMDGYSWTINGKDIQTIYNRDRTDLKVTKNTNNIPGSTVTAVAGDNPSLQISLAHEGDFGFKATLSIGVGSEHAGKYGNLYYHDKNGKLVFIDACQINSEGNVSLVFSHASDYLLVISDQAMSQVNVPENLKPAGTNQNGTASAVNTNSNGTRSPKTGDYTAVYPWLLLCAAAAGYTMVYGSRRKRVQK